MQKNNTIKAKIKNPLWVAEKLQKLEINYTTRVRFKSQCSVRFKPNAIYSFRGK